MKSLGDDSLPIDVTRDERVDSNREVMTVPPTAVDDTVSPQHLKETYNQFTTPDNVDISRHPLHVGFLVSFLVDARGGAMRGCRHSGVRVIVPPRRASMPMRVTCRYLKRDKLSHPPPLMEGEALASRILEFGPVGAKFLGPVMIEVPHFGSLRGKEREIVILRSDNGETWREHTVEANDEAVQDILSHSFDKEEMAQLEDASRTTRILTTDFPHYFAVVTRVRQEVHAIGPEGGMVSSSVVPQVQAVFPQGALTKKIKVGLQAQPISAELAAKLLGNRVAVSPIVTVEPRRRKFHKPITLTIPKPQAANKGMINQYSGDAPTLRLLCSITGGTTRAQWEDVTGSTPFTFVNDCVSFTTTVSARFWLMDCRNISDASKMATELYKEAIHVPFMAKFVVFSKRVDVLEARLRVFCMTDDKEDKTLEHQEHFTEVAKSRDVEVLEGKSQYIEFAGNLIPVTKSGEQLQLGFRAFRENRLPFTVRVKDPHADTIGRMLFMREPKVAKGEPPQQPICILNIVLPEEIIPDTGVLDHDLHKYSFIKDSSGLESYQRADLRLSDISNLLGEDWVRLAGDLGVTTSDVNRLKSEYPNSDAQQGLAMLRLWVQQAGNKAQASTLEAALNRIGRDDIVQQCIFNIDQSGFDLLKEELGPSRDASLKRNINVDNVFSDQEIMKDTVSREEITRVNGRKAGEPVEKDDKEESKYIAEEKEVEEVKKSVSERRKEIEERLSSQEKQKEKIIEKRPSKDKQLVEETVVVTQKQKIVEDLSEKEIPEEKKFSQDQFPEPSDLPFEQKRLSFEQGKKIIEMKPDKMKFEPKERIEEKFLVEERKVSTIIDDKKTEAEEKVLTFQEKRMSFEQGLKQSESLDKEVKHTVEDKRTEERRLQDQRRDSELFEGVSQGLVRLDIAAFVATPQVQDILSPKVSKTPPPSPAEFSRDTTGTVAWEDKSAAFLSTKTSTAQDWSKKSEKPVEEPTAATVADSQEKLEPVTGPVDFNILLAEHFDLIESTKAFLEAETAPVTTYITAEKITVITTLTDKPKPEELSEETHIDNKETGEKSAKEVEKSDKKTKSLEKGSKSKNVDKSDIKDGDKQEKSFVGKFSKKIFGVFKKDDSKEKKDESKEKTKTVVDESKENAKETIEKSPEKKTAKEETQKLGEAKAAEKVTVAEWKGPDVVPLKVNETKEERSQITDAKNRVVHSTVGIEELAKATKGKVADMVIDTTDTVFVQTVTVAQKSKESKDNITKDASDTAKTMVTEVLEFVSHEKDQIDDKGREAKHTAGEIVSNIEGNAEQSVGTVEQRTTDIIVKTVEEIDDEKHKTIEVGNDVKNAITDTGIELKEKLTEAGSDAKLKAQHVVDKTVETGKHSKDKLVEVSHEVKDKASHSTADVKEKSFSFGNIFGLGKKTKEKVSDSASETKEKSIEAVTENAAKIKDAPGKLTDVTQVESIDITTKATETGKDTFTEYAGDIQGKVQPAETDVQGIQDKTTETVMQIAGDTDVKAKETTSEVSEKPQDIGTNIFGCGKKTKHGILDLSGDVKHKVSDIGHVVLEKSKESKDTVVDIAGGIKHKTVDIGTGSIEVSKKGKDKVDEIAGGIKHKAVDIGTDTVEIGKKGKNIVVEVGGAIKDKAVDIGAGSIEAAKKGKDKVVDVSGGIKDKAVEVGGDVKDKAVDIGARSIEVTKNGKDKILEVAGGIKDKTVDIGAGTVEIGKKGKDMVIEVGSDIKDKAVDIGAGSIEVTKQGKDKIIEVAGGIKDKAVDIGAESIEAGKKGKDKVVEVVGGIKDKAVDIGAESIEAGKKGKDKVVEVTGGIKDKAVDIGAESIAAGKKGKDKVVEVAGGIKDKAVDIGAESIEAGKKAKDKVVEVAGGIKDKAVDIGAESIEAGKKGKDKVVEVAGGIKDKAVDIAADSVQIGKKGKDKAVDLGKKGKEKVVSLADGLKNKAADIGVEVAGKSKKVAAKVGSDVKEQLVGIGSDLIYVGKVSDDITDKPVEEKVKKRKVEVVEIVRNDSLEEEPWPNLADDIRETAQFLIAETFGKAAVYVPQYRNTLFPNEEPTVEKDNTSAGNIKYSDTVSSTPSHLTKKEDEKLTNILIDMLIEQERIKTSPDQDTASQTQSISSDGKDTKQSTPKTTPVTKKTVSEMRSSSSSSNIELTQTTESESTDSVKSDETVTSYVTTPTLQRRGIGGSQRLSREERPFLREVTNLLTDDSSSGDEDYIVTEPHEKSPSNQRKVTFRFEENYEEEEEEESESSSISSGYEYKIEVQELTPSPVPPPENEVKGTRVVQFESFGRKDAINKTTGSLEKSIERKTDSKRFKTAERKFERMASETVKGTDQGAAEGEFQKMVSQLSTEEVDECLQMWDEGGLTPSEELDSRSTPEGELEDGFHVGPAAFISSTSVFESSVPTAQLIDIDIDKCSDVPSSIFWGFDFRQPRNSVVELDDLDVPIKTQGESAVDDSKKASVTSAETSVQKEGEEGLFDIAAGFQDTPASSGTGTPAPGSLPSQKPK